MNAGHIEASNFTAVRPTARAVAALYLKQFHPGARSHGDPVSIDESPVKGVSMQSHFETASGELMAMYLGEAPGGGWKVNARARIASEEATA